MRERRRRFHSFNTILFFTVNPNSSSFLGGKEEDAKFFMLVPVLVRKISMDVTAAALFLF